MLHRRARATAIALPLAALLAGSVLAQEGTPPDLPATAPADDGFVIIWEGELDDGFVVIGEDRSNDTGFLPGLATPAEARPVPPFAPVPRAGTPPARP